ncbi:MAG: aromatic ring-hydroxylating dioxygenase subunit alpha [Cyanobacteria bacterium P01_F01_bin.33]
MIPKPVVPSHEVSASSVELLERPSTQPQRQIGLPAEAYVSANYLERERRTVFRQHWVCVGLASDLPHPGDVYPTDVAGMPIVLVRDGGKSGGDRAAPTLRAFHNVCRHRGLQLVDKSCNARGHLRCPYHAWTYRLNGTLISTPHFGGYFQDATEALDRSTKGLIPIRCEQWLDLVFVNLSGDGPPLAEYLRSVRDRWSDYDLSLLRREPREIRLHCNANWKLAVENFSESYHLSWVHPALNKCSRMEDHFPFDLDGIHVGQGSLHYQSGVLAGKSLPTFPHLEVLGKQTVAEYITVFPNLMLGVHPDYFLAFIVNPLAPDKTAERMAFYFAGDEAMTPENEALRHLPIDLWNVTNDEDIEMIERMQVGRMSPGFDGGCFSPALEQPGYHFQQAVARAVARA